MIRTVATDTVRRMLIDRHELALFDVRDEASFAEAHPLFAASLPLDRVAALPTCRLCDMR